MPSHEHNKLIERISQIDKLPEDPAKYATWLEADAHLSLLQDNAEEDELIVYADGKYIFIHGVVVNKDNLCPLDQDDLLDWNGNPFSLCAGYVWGSERDDVWIERGGLIHGTKTLESAQQLIFAREFAGLHSEARIYSEVSFKNSTHITMIFIGQGEHNCLLPDSMGVGESPTRHIASTEGTVIQRLYRS